MTEIQRSFNWREIEILINALPKFMSKKILDNDCGDTRFPSQAHHELFIFHCNEIFHQLKKSVQLLEIFSIKKMKVSSLLLRVFTEAHSICSTKKFGEPFHGSFLVHKHSQFLVSIVKKPK